MYLDFPSGRIKLLGTLVFPKSKYVVMRNGVGQVLLEDFFETLVRKTCIMQPIMLQEGVFSGGAVRVL